MKSLINGVQPVKSAQSQVAPSMKSSGEDQETFAKTLKDAIEHVNDAQHASDVKTEALSKGHIDDLHEVMVSAQKASITLETTVQIQRKVIDAYNEIMRMQV